MPLLIGNLHFFRAACSNWLKAQSYAGLVRKGCFDLPKPKTNQLNKGVIYRDFSQRNTLPFNIRSIKGKYRLKKSQK
jgi:predicted RecA/RadA family phage recombinase